MHTDVPLPSQIWTQIIAVPVPRVVPSITFKTTDLVYSQNTQSKSGPYWWEGSFGSHTVTLFEHWWILKNNFWPEEGDCCHSRLTCTARIGHRLDLKGSDSVLVRVKRSHIHRREMCLGGKKPLYKPVFIKHVSFIMNGWFIRAWMSRIDHIPAKNKQRTDS